jgi:putative transcriptional regulator
MVSPLETLAPGLLIAAPSLKDPNFDHTVILMCVHNEQGAMGLVVNRPAPVSLGDIMQQMEIEHEAQDTTQAALVGGPVALDSGLLLYELDPSSEVRDDELKVTDHLRLCPSQEMLRSIGRGEGPSRYHIFLGHSGWGPGQLESEIAQGAWIPGQLDTNLIFVTPIDQRWEASLRAEGLHPAQFGAFRPAN